MNDWMGMRERDRESVCVCVCERVRKRTIQQLNEQESERIHAHGFTQLIMFGLMAMTQYRQGFYAASVPDTGSSQTVNSAAG